MGTKSQVISDTVEFRHAYRTIPAPSAEDRIAHGLQAVADALTETPPPTTISQLNAFTNLRDLFELWRLLGPPLAGNNRGPAPVHPRVAAPELPPTPVVQTPRVGASPLPAWSPPPPPASALHPRHPDPAIVTLWRIVFANDPLQGWISYHLQGWPMNPVCHQLSQRGNLLRTEPVPVQALTLLSLQVGFQLLNHLHSLLAYRWVLLASVNCIQ
jgi:hypothetical protein